MHNDLGMSPYSFSGLDLLSIAVVIVDRQLELRYANPSAENLFALSRRQLCRMSLAAVVGNVPALFATVRQAAEHNWSYTEQEIDIAPTGRQRLHVSCTVSPIDSESGWLLLEIRPLDQHIKVEREDRLLEQQGANRELIRNLAHEIKNPLGGIRGAAQLLERELADPQQREFTQVIIAEADRLQTLVNRLLAPHRLPHFQLANVHEILHRVRQLILAEYPQGLAIRTDFDVSLPELECDPEQILQTMLNIARNAAQAMDGRGEIRLRTRVARQVTVAKRRHRLAIAVAIEDNGPGVPDDLREKIFFPLVSGREGGSGLGLTIAQTFVQQHRGSIELESEPGRTCFTVTLPFDAKSPLNGNGTGNGSAAYTSSP